MVGGKKKSLPDGKYIRKKDPRAWDRKTDLDLTPAIDVIVTHKIKKQDIYLKELIGMYICIYKYVYICICMYIRIYRNMYIIYK
jgi:hypothetical protein